MSDERQGRVRRNRKSGAWTLGILLLVTVAAGALFLAACGPSQPTSAPTVVALTVVSTSEDPTATRMPDPTATPVPTRTPFPTHTPTSTGTPLSPTATATPVPTDTPRPTSTAVPPTDTPVPPTNTPVPPTDTPRPTATKAPPSTKTPPPPPQFPWRGQVVGTFSNCALTRVMGLTLARNGGIAGDIWVHWWAEGWDGAWGRSTWGVNEGLPGLDDSSNWDGILDTYPKAGTWHVCVVPAEGNWDCISSTVTAETTADPCAPESGGVQVVRIVFQQN
jgi:hypothetical protein